MNRRSFLKTISTILLYFSYKAEAFSSNDNNDLLIDDFKREDDFYIGDSWESLTPGYWYIKNQSLRRRLTSYGSKVQAAGFPYHYETHGGKLKKEYDYSLPLGILWNREWKLKNDFKINLECKIINSPVLNKLDSSAFYFDVDDGKKKKMKMYSRDYSLLSLSFDGKAQFEGYIPNHDACPMLVLFQNGLFGFMSHTNQKLSLIESPLPNKRKNLIKVGRLKKGDLIKLSLTAQVKNNERTILGSLKINNKRRKFVALTQNILPEINNGYFGIGTRGLLDYQITKVSLSPYYNKKLNAPVNTLYVCYPLGDTLKQKHNKWSVKFVAIFRQSQKIASIKISNKKNLGENWNQIPVAGTADILSNNFRRNTAVIDVQLPYNPAETEMYFTVWADGKNVTADPRLGTDSTGPGTGLVGDVPKHGNYEGRLPQLIAPYKVCGLSCHAISNASKVDLPDAGTHWQHVSRSFFIHDQPTYGAFKSIEDFNFQVLLWDDDIWYLELVTFPPSTDDAYKIITTTLGGPTTRWKMMRHWNVLNSGDHDNGIDDYKGPEQLLLRNNHGLGNDRDYFRRNSQIIDHLTRGIEEPDAIHNPKRWRKWKMPERDFSIIITDSRLWRSSQDTNIWKDQGWSNIKNPYSRKDPTRTLLGEEQFAWLQEQIKTDTSPLICVSGINALHTVWMGITNSERDRVFADYAGWAEKGANRVLDILSNRDGVISVYGDVHVGSIFQNKELRLIEASFGPIGRWGGRALVPTFSENMDDLDGRSLKCIALYHDTYNDKYLNPAKDPIYWNFMEMIFDTTSQIPKITLKIRNIVDNPSMEPRGGDFLSIKTSETGKKITCRLPEIETIPDADVIFFTNESKIIRGARSDREGKVNVEGLIDIKPNSMVYIFAKSLTDLDTQKIKTLVI